MYLFIWYMPTYAITNTVLHISNTVSNGSKMEGLHLLTHPTHPLIYTCAYIIILINSGYHNLHINLSDYKL